MLHKTNHPVATEAECKAVRDEAENGASQIQWTTNRHGNFPTTALRLVELPQTLAFLRQAPVERIYPLLQSQFGSFLPEANRLRVADGFVAK